MFTMAFTDPQGTSYKGAVFQVLRADFLDSSNESYSYDTREGKGTVGEHAVNFSLNYRVGYWPSQEAKDAGAPPYTLIDAETYNADFASYSLPEEQYGGLSAEAAAELHCKTEVLGAGE